MELGTIKDVAKKLSCGIRFAREWCRERGIVPINLTPHKKKRVLRYSLDEVNDVLSTLQAENKFPSSFVKRSAHTVSGKSAAELFRELSEQRQWQ